MVHGRRNGRTRRLVRFGRDETGSVMASFALAVGGMIVAAGVAIDYANASSQRSKLQAVADAAVIAAVREFRLGNASEGNVRQAVIAHARASLGGGMNDLSVTPVADSKARSVTAKLTAHVPTYLLHYVGRQFTAVSVQASAKLSGGVPVCVLGLDLDANGTIELDKDAELSAPGCAVYSNSKKPDGIKVKDQGLLSAHFICSAGGKIGSKDGSFAPTPKTDCPVLSDPLRSRSLPARGACLATGLELKGASVNLAPGTYCGGLKITDGASVTMMPGTFVFTDGRLEVGDGSTLRGENVALHFSGGKAAMKFDPNSSVSLTAPKSGDMAGLLITEERTNPQDQRFEILSNDARTLLGTIYLPQGRLYVAAKKPVGDQSAYTIVVARRFSLSEGPTMVLNTNYGATDIPVPNGVGPTAGGHLTQ